MQVLLYFCTEMDTQSSKTYFIPLLVSIVLLPCFIGYFLWSEFQNEKQTMKTEIRESVFSDMFTELDNIVTESGEKSQSTDHKAISTKFIKLQNLNTSKVYDQLPSPDSLVTRKLSGFLAIDTLTQQDSTPQLTITVQRREDAIFPDTIVDLKGFVAFDLDSIPELNSTKLITEHSRTSLNSRFRIGQPNIDNKDVIKRMAPQIAFSLLLLGSIFWTFIMIYRSLIKERQLSEMRNSLMSNMSHELKTPVTTIGVALEALSNFDAAGNQEMRKEYIDITRQEVKRLDMLVDKTLSLSLLQSGKFQLETEHVNLQSEIQNVVKAMQVLTQSYNGQINIIEKGDDFTIVTDKIHITNVIFNLIENALKYAGPNPKIDILLMATDQYIELSVSDDGPGIPLQYKDQVFEKLFRVPTGDVHNIKGHGLGLSYVKNVVTRLGGTIKLSQSNAAGASFTINLPNSF